MRFKTKQSAVDYLYNKFFWKRSQVTEDRILDPQIIIDSGLEKEVEDDDVFVASEEFPDLYFQPTGKTVLWLNNGKVSKKSIYHTDYWKVKRNVPYDYVRRNICREDGSRYQPHISVHKQVGEIFGKIGVNPEMHKKEDGSHREMQFHHLKGVKENGYRDTVGITDDVHYILGSVKSYRVWYGPEKGFVEKNLDDLLSHISCEKRLDFFIDFVKSVYDNKIAGNKEIYEKEIVTEDEIVVPVRHFSKEKGKEGERWRDLSYRIQLVFKKQTPKGKKKIS